MTRIFVQPAPGLLVRKPIGGVLAATGEWQNEDAYWTRRLLDGDVVEVAGAVELQEAKEPQELQVAQAVSAASSTEDKAAADVVLAPATTKPPKK